ncbi:BLUF domain-containing protein [Curtobacterium sp. RRHDQ10]|uniref:BLUF domain-containing protein n=1 Tax=Curtobacterium phyllosphaerae TaxID=3413379 RepID=UPI003BF0F172
MLSIVYVSTATTPPDDAELAAILKVARRRNTELGVTGLLAYREGRFLQLVEGPDDAVDALYENIATDPRHRDVQLLDRDTVTQRWFPDWAMAFEPLDDDAVAGLEGFRDFFTSTGELGAAAASSRTQAILYWFRRHALSAAA